jgi:hypothetical protein
MKNLIIILLVLVSFKAGAQNSNPSEAKIPPVYFIDSVKISDASPYLTYMNTDEVANIHVDKNKTYPNGVIFITLKDHRKLAEMLQDKLLSISDITKANISPSEKNSPVIYLLDDKLLTDTAGIRIPSKFVRQVTLTKADETAYFKTALPNVLLMKIATKPPVIMIRGQVAAR